MNPTPDWKRSSSAPGMETFTDKYAIRYVHRYIHRVEVYKFYITTCTYSDTMAFWYEDYATPEDAVLAAKLRAMRGELQFDPPSIVVGVYPKPAELLIRAPDPTVSRTGW